MNLEYQLKDLLGRVNLCAFRLLLDTPGVNATVPMIRGVWGRALRHIDEKAYQNIFLGDGPAHFRIPRYLMRPAPPDPATAPAIEWIIFTELGESSDSLIRAWDVACGMGLGKDRIPFRIRKFVPIRPIPMSCQIPKLETWPLSNSIWPIDSDPSSTPCQISFEVPLRLTIGGKLNIQPTFSDIALAVLRRVSSLAGCSGDEHRNFAMAVSEETSKVPATTWRGKKLDFSRWSGTQGQEVELFGVVGLLGLPQGVGRVWPLFAAACWTHIGKGTVFGLGQPKILRIA